MATHLRTMPDGAVDESLASSTPNVFIGGCQVQTGEHLHASASLDGKRSSPNDSDAPDGGVAAWLVVAGAWCVSFCSFGWLSSIGTFQEYYASTLLSQYSASTIAWIPSLQIFFMNAMGPIVGIAYDNFGPRHMLLLGSLLHVFGVMMVSLCTRYYQIMLAQGVCSAIGASAIFQPALNCIHGWFGSKRGLAFGILATGSSLGGVVFPIMISRLIKQVGFPWTLRICAFLILGLLAVANLTVRPFHAPRPQKITSSQLTKPFHEPAFIYLCLGFLFFTFGVFVPINYLPSQALDAGVASNLAQYLLPILNASSLFGRVFSGFAGDKVGRYNIFIVVGLLEAVWTLALWVTWHSSAGTIVYAALFGFCSGAYVSMIAPLIAQISPISEIGFRTGIVFFVSSIGGLTTNPIGGAILGNDRNWLGVQIFSGILCLIGTFFVVMSKADRTGWTIWARF